MRTIPLLTALAACSGPTTAPGTDTTGSGSGSTVDTTTDTQTTTSHPGACGDKTTWDLVIKGTVVGPSHQPAPNATVALEERLYDAQPKTYGTATTNDNGNFELAAPGVVSIEDCWGILLDYHLLASSGSASADDTVNQSLYGAILDGSLVAVLAVPIQLEASGSGP